VLEGERSTLIAVAVQASRFVRGEALRHGRANTAVGIVAIDAAHRPFRQTVMSGLLELCPDVLMTPCALSVDLRRLSYYEPIRTIRVNLVARDARYGTVSVAALQASDVRGLIEMALETGLVGGRRGQLGGIMDQRGVTRSGMQRAHPVAGLAASSLEAPPGGDFHNVVWAFDERIENVLMAGLAGFGPNKIRLLRWG